MTVIQTDDEEFISEEQLDTCCLAFVNDNDNSLRESCVISVTSLPGQLLYDSENMCRTRTVTSTSFSLPDTLSLVKTEFGELFIEEINDACCQAFVEGDDQM